MTAYRGFNLNDPSTPPPWGATEQQVFEDMANTMLADSIGGVKDNAGHKHGTLYSPSAGAVISVDGSSNVGVGVASTGNKVHVDGDCNITSGHHYKINNVNVGPSDVGAEVAGAVNTAINGTINVLQKIDPSNIHKLVDSQIADNGIVLTISTYRCTIAGVLSLFPVIIQPPDTTDPYIIDMDTIGGSFLQVDNLDHTASRELWTSNAHTGDVLILQNVGSYGFDMQELPNCTSAHFTIPTSPAYAVYQFLCIDGATNHWAKLVPVA